MEFAVALVSGFIAGIIAAKVNHINDSLKQRDQESDLIYFSN